MCSMRAIYGNSWNVLKILEIFVKVNELETRVKCFRLLKGENELGLKNLKVSKGFEHGDA